jgi:hypothetical protein
MPLHTHCVNVPCEFIILMHVPYSYYDLHYLLKPLSVKTRAPKKALASVMAPAGTALETTALQFRRLNVLNLSEKSYVFNKD